MTDALVALAQKTLAAPVINAYGPDGPARSITGNFWNEDHQADALPPGMSPTSRRCSTPGPS